MAKIGFSGLDVYVRRLERLSVNSEEITKKALYQGAKVVADTVKEELKNLPTDETWGTESKPAIGIKQEQKDALIESFGISPAQNDDGFINVKLGFDGYNNVVSKKYPDGQPNAMIARIAESGTSFSRKTPFMATAIRRSKKIAEIEMEKIFENETKKILKE